MCRGKGERRELILWQPDTVLLSGVTRSCVATTLRCALVLSESAAAQPFREGTLWTTVNLGPADVHVDVFNLHELNLVWYCGNLQLVEGVAIRS